MTSVAEQDARAMKAANEVVAAFAARVEWSFDDDDLAEFYRIITRHIIARNIITRHYADLVAQNAKMREALAKLIDVVDDIAAGNDQRLHWDAYSKTQSDAIAILAEGGAA